MSAAAGRAVGVVSAVGARRGLRLVALALEVALGVLCADDAAAHTRSQSFSSWTLDATGATVVARMPLVALAPVLAPDLAPDAFAAEVGSYVSTRLTLRAGGAPCPLIAGPTVLRPAADRVAVEWRVACQAARAGETGPDERLRTIETALLLDVVPSHLHFARLRVGTASPVEHVLSAGAPRWEIPAVDHVGRASIAPAASGGASLATYLHLGIGHIASGADHLAFVVALLLAAASWREVAVMVTGFTAGHSLTLALAALALLGVDGRTVEALIGLSITLVATENVAVITGRARLLGVVSAAALAGLAALRVAGVGGCAALSLAGLALFAACSFALVDRLARPAPLRALVALLFGLIHGLGFGGVLLEVGLPPGRALPALFGFNAGVEIGQLAVVAVAWPMLLVARRRIAPSDVTAAGSAVLAGLGLYWFVGRAFG